MPRQRSGQQQGAHSCFSGVQERRVQALQFGLLSPETVSSMSVAEVKSTQIYDQVTFQPNFHAINDPRMGVTDKDQRCFTCKAGMLRYLIKILKCVCFNCSKLLVCKVSPSDATPTADVQKQFDNLKELEDRQMLQRIKDGKIRFKKLLSLAESIKVCESEKGGCGYKQPKYLKKGLSIDIEYRDENFDNTRDRKETLWPSDACRVLERVSDEDCRLLGFAPEQCRPDWAIIRNLPVAPPPVRPSVAMSSTMRSEDDLTYAYQQVVKINIALKEQREKGANQTIINELHTSLQYYVATLMDNKIAGQPIQKHKSGKVIKCVRSRLKGKEGRLRGHLMGKRVDFSSRTVITPDPNLDLDQLGVPLVIAMGLTVPETVTTQNIDKLRLLVENGPSQWPGAKYIIRHDERQIDLSMLRNRSDVHLEAGYKVERHLQNGDYVLFNRQPSLHKMSIMGHRVKVLPYLTFRLNLSVTTPYNADFDGDEMNMHVPQSFESLAEIKEIMAVPRQIISPQSNKPVMGIVQDSLLGSMLMTQRDVFIDREEAMQLFMWVPDIGVSGEVNQLPPPALIKPRPLWTGKQIFSLLIPNLNMQRVKERANQFCCQKDSNILIEEGELLMGSLTKQMVGSVGQGLVHLIFREYGHQSCAEFLSAVQKLVNSWLITQGFTVGVQDIIVDKVSTSSSISATLAKFKQRVSRIVLSSQLGKLKSQPGKSMQESFEAQVNKKLNDARDKSGNIALDGLSLHNRLRNMVSAGSKGSNINISQIMACVGQQNVEGRRIPFGFDKRTLPHFSKDDFGPESKGFVESSYLSGLSPAELYFHAMGGREGLIDTAVKTAETGYISRRLIKALEDIMVQYDGTVRTSRDHLIQFVYGEDGMAGESIENVTIDLLKASDAEVTNTCQFPVPGLSEDAEKLVNDSMNEHVLQQMRVVPQSETEALQHEFKTILEDRDMLRSEVFRTNIDDQIHLPVNIARLIWNAKAQFKVRPNAKSDLTPSTVTSKLTSLLNDLSVLPGSKRVQSSILVDADLNARRLFNIYMRYALCAKNVIIKDRLPCSAFDWLLAEIKSRFETSLSNPGEMVGSLAAQSMGEPATQMTLNTFHFAGISAKNVTLGVPRFKEIINVSNNIKTPGLKIFLRDKYKKRESKVSKLGMQIEYTTLSHVVNQSAIYFDPNPERTVIPDDEMLVQLYNDVSADENASKAAQSPWLLRLELDREKMVHKGLQMSMIDKKLSEVFGETINVMVTDENSDRHVVRIRINCIQDDSEETVASYLKNEFEPMVLSHLALKGIPEISKVNYTKHQEHAYDPKTGKLAFTDDSWVIETDGTALAKIMCLSKVDATKTVSNDNIEVLSVLGIEAARQSLINELRFVFSSYGIYVNYRHISTLVDVMTQRGKLTSITRHGINRLESSGPLRKCSFEETVEILLEGAMFAEKDLLSGISENIIMGQLGPFGSGSFGLTIDPTVIETYALQSMGYHGIFNRLDEMEDTPVVAENGEAITQAMTPMIAFTPAIGMAGSSYDMMSAMQTPGMATPGMQSPNMGAFSPNMMGADGNYNYGSLGISSPSPYYSGPAFGQGAHGSGQYASPIYGNSLPLSSGQVGYPQSPIYQHRAAQQSGHYASPAYKQESGAPVPQYSPAYGYGPVVSPAYTSAINAGGSSSLSGQKHQQQNPFVSPIYSPSAAIQSPAYTSQVSRSAQKACNYLGGAAPYSPAYSPAMSGQASKAHLDAASAGSGAHNLVQSPLYQPPSMGGSAKQPPYASGGGVDYSKTVQSPQYVTQIGLVSAADIVQSPAYNPASPQYGAPMQNQQEKPLTSRRRSKLLHAVPRNTIKEELKEDSD